MWGRAKAKETALTAIGDALASGAGFTVAQMRVWRARIEFEDMGGTRQQWIAVWDARRRPSDGQSVCVGDDS